MSAREQGQLHVVSNIGEQRREICGDLDRDDPVQLAVEEPDLEIGLTERFSLVGVPADVWVAGR